MPFPSEFPDSALHELAGVLTGGDHAPSRVALAGYEMVGYWLYLAFGDVKYLMNATPESVAKAEKLRTVIGPDVLNALKSIPLSDIVKAIEAGLASNGNPYLLAIELAIEFGPKLLPVIKALIQAMKGV